MKGEKEADCDKQIQRLDYSITDLPMPIFVDILLRLPVKTILLCRCVSKTWGNQILDPQFAKLHFSGQEACALLRTLGSNRVSRMLYLVEPDTCHNFDLGYCLCDSGCYGFSTCCHDRYLKTCHNYDSDHLALGGICYGACSDPCVKTRHMKLDTKLKIPLRNAEMVLNTEVGDAQRGCSSKGSRVKRKRCIKVKPKEQRFKIVNSCNGFLCLCEPSLDDPLVVCNPITGEYTNLPVAKRDSEKTKGFIDYGFGFSPSTNQYKVVRMFNQLTRDPVTRIKTYSRRTEIHTLGTESWKSIGGGPVSSYKLAFPTYLEGCIHWICIDFRSSGYIVSFNFGNEQFQSVPPPPCKNGSTNTVSLSAMRNVSMGVLDGCLCICAASNYINIWVMKKYGVLESWTKMFSIDTLTKRWPVGLYQPIKYLKDGAILMFHYFSSSLICYDPNGPTFKYLKIYGTKSKFEAIAYIPSFISLKEAVVGDNAMVLNIYSRCAELKVRGETEDLSLAEKNRDITSDDSDDDLDYSSSETRKWRKHLFVFRY